MDDIRELILERMYEIKTQQAVERVKDEVKYELVKMFDICNEMHNTLRDLKEKGKDVEKEWGLLSELFGIYRNLLILVNKR